MGVASVGLVYDLTRRHFGRGAGTVAGLALALTPAMVAVSRHNNPDALLVLCSTAAVWALVRGLEDGRTRWLVLSGVCVGLGFETKMAAALLVVPAIAAAWMWAAPRGRLAAARQLLAGGAAMLLVGLAWPLLVWLTPASSRPWISGTADNSIWSLILGYNGLGRLFGQDGGPGGAGGPGGGPGGGGAFGGEPGALRLLNQALGGQAGWLLGFAAVAGIALVVSTRLRREDLRTGWLIVVGGTFLTIVVAFSRAEGIFHPYYVSQLAPFSAALVGAGAAKLSSRSALARAAGPLAIAAGVIAETKVLGDNPGSLAWLPPVLIAGGIAASAALLIVNAPRTRAYVAAAAIGLLLLAPGVWSFETLGHATSGTFPAGGPVSAATMGGPGGRRRPPQGVQPGAGTGAALPRRAPPPMEAASDGMGAPPAGAAMPATGMGPMAMGGPGADSGDITQALAYIKAHGGGTLAVSGQSGTTGRLVTQGADLVAIGGFSGRESQVTAAWLADAIDAGKIKYVLTSGGSFGRQDDRVGASEVMSLVTQTGKAVSSVDGLYDVSGAAAALRASGV